MHLLPCLFFKQKKIISAKVYSKTQNIRNSKSIPWFNDLFTCQKCWKVRIKERILSTGSKNLFELWRLSNYRDSNYGKINIRVSFIRNFTVTLHLIELWRFELERWYCISTTKLRIFKIEEAKVKFLVRIILIF